MKKVSHKRQIASWIIFDVAVATFAQLVTSFLFPQYVKNTLGGNELQVGLAVSISILFVAIVTPILGTYSDITGRRVSIIRWFVLGVIASMLLMLFPNVWTVLIFYAIALFFANNILVLFDSLLASIAPKKLGLVAGLGVGSGSLGIVMGIALLAAILFILNGMKYPEIISVQNMQVLILVAAVLYAIWSLPLLLFVKDEVKKTTLKTALNTSIHNIKTTWSELRNYPNIMRFYIGEFCYNNGIIALGVFLVLFAQQEFNLTLVEFGFAFAGFLLVGLVAALVFGFLIDKIGPKKIQIGGLIIWLVVISLILIVKNQELFFLLGALGGIATGMLLTAARPMLIALAPPEKIGHFFGFYEIVGRASGVIGPAIFGWLVVVAGYSAGLIFVLVLVFLAIIFIGQISGKYGKIQL